jgi:hypothetical protein
MSRIVGLFSRVTGRTNQQASDDIRFCDACSKVSTLSDRVTARRLGTPLLPGPRA